MLVLANILVTKLFGYSQFTKLFYLLFGFYNAVVEKPYWNFSFGSFYVR